MISRDGYPQQPEAPSVLEDMLRRHTLEQFRAGVYDAWIELVDRYFTGTRGNEENQAKLSAFARSEMPLGAVVWRDSDNRYPGVNAYFLVKVDPKTGERVKFGEFGLEPIIVAHVDNDGNIVVKNGNEKPTVYSDEQVQVVVRQAHEMEAAGFVFNPEPRIVYNNQGRATLINRLEDVGRSVRW